MGKDPYYSKLTQIRERFADLKKEEQQARLQYIKNPGEESEKRLKELGSQVDNMEGELLDLADEVKTETKVLSQRGQDAWKTLYDWQKHVSTLSVATVAGLVALLQLETLGEGAREDAVNACMYLLATVLLSIFSMLLDAMRLLDEPISGRRGSLSETAGPLFRWATKVIFWIHWPLRVVSILAFVAGVTSAVSVISSAL